MNLAPSEIRYSQDSIGRTFGKCTSHPYRPIGETLDDILLGRCQITDIPQIGVVNRNRLWFTTDNRRLWVFQKAEEFGKCDTIPVYKSSYIDPAKFTTYNDGKSVDVRGNVGGRYWRSCTRVKKQRIHPIRQSDRCDTRDELTNYTDILDRSVDRITNRSYGNAFIGFPNTMLGVTRKDSVGIAHVYNGNQEKVSPEIMDDSTSSVDEVYGESGLQYSYGKQVLNENTFKGSKGNSYTEYSFTNEGSKENLPRIYQIESTPNYCSSEARSNSGGQKGFSGGSIDIRTNQANDTYYIPMNDDISDNENERSCLYRLFCTWFTTKS